MEISFLLKPFFICEKDFIFVACYSKKRMNYPLLTEYVEAIKAAENYFGQLKHLRLVIGDGYIYYFIVNEYGVG